jgi:hypothetical protein
MNREMFQMTDEERKKRVQEMLPVLKNLHEDMRKFCMKCPWNSSDKICPLCKTWGWCPFFGEGFEKNISIPTIELILGGKEAFEKFKADNDKKRLEEYEKKREVWDQIPKKMSVIV